MLIWNYKDVKFRMTVEAVTNFVFTHSPRETTTVIIIKKISVGVYIGSLRPFSSIFGSIDLYREPCVRVYLIIIYSLLPQTSRPILIYEL